MTMIKLFLINVLVPLLFSDLREHTERVSLIRKVEAFKNEDMQMEANRLKAALNFMNMKSGATSYIITMDPEFAPYWNMRRARESKERQRQTSYKISFKYLTQKTIILKSFFTRRVSMWTLR